MPGHLLREYHAYAPYYRDPQCPADYRIEANIEGNWQSIAEVSDNYQRQRIHELDAPITADQVRIVVTKTNGDPSAAIYEIRCYS